jgi:hypothetical protein
MEFLKPLRMSIRGSLKMEFTMAMERPHGIQEVLMRVHTKMVRKMDMVYTEERTDVVMKESGLKVNVTVRVWR